MTTPASPSAPAGAPPSAGGTPPAVADDGPAAAVPGAPAPADELERLRAEVAALRGELASRRRTWVRPAAIRRTVAAVLAAVAAFALVTSMVGWWAARTTSSTDRWVTTVAPLPRDPKVTAAVAQYATTELFRALDVEQRVRAALPEQVAFAAGPITGQLREQVRETVVTVLGSDRFQAVWVEMNRQAHRSALAVIEGTSTVVTARSDRIEINLLPLINQVLRELSAQMPTLFGKQLTLPDLSSGEIPENLRLRVEKELGVPLPANFAQFTVHDAGRLWRAQQTVAAAERYLTLFAGATLLLLLAAFSVSPWRRRTTVQFGIWLVAAAVTVTVVLRAFRRHLLAQVPAGTYRDGVDAAMTTVFRLLRERGAQLAVIGALLAVLAFLAGPGRFPVWLRGGARRAAAAGWRWTRAGGAIAVRRGPGFIARYRDPLRVAGLAVAGVLALILSSWTSLLVIVILLTAYEMVVTLIARRAGPAFRIAG